VAQAINDHSAPHRLLVLDCLTLWLTNVLMPMEAVAAKNSISNTDPAQHHQVQAAHLLEALQHATGPVVLVGNEIGLGVIPLGLEVRAFVDALGRLNQDVASVADRVVLMVAGCPLVIK
jgi:adenosylcobinamide kinase/adenosylcobinamide-phosphate guanylyltransferase